MESRAPYAHQRTSSQFAISRILHQKNFPAAIRVGDLRRNYQGSLTGITALTCAVETLVAYQEIVSEAVRSLNPGIADLEANQTWKRVKVHGVTIV